MAEKYSMNGALKALGKNVLKLLGQLRSSLLKCWKHLQEKIKRDEAETTF